MGAETKRPPYTPWVTRVVVHEPGITDREGLVTDVKWSPRLDVWYVGVQYEDGMVRTVPAMYVAGAVAR